MEWAFTQKTVRLCSPVRENQKRVCSPYNGIVSLSVESSLPLFFIFKKTI